MINLLSRREFIKYLSKLFAISTLSVGSTVVSGCSSGEDTANYGAPVESKRRAQQDKSADSHEEDHPQLGIASGGSPTDNTKAALDEIGGIDGFVKKGNTVVIKPNILYAAEPEYAATTNPQVIEALVSLCVSAGASDVLVIDRPTDSADEAYTTTGIGRATEKAGGRVKVLQDRDFVQSAIPGGKTLKSWPIARDALRADVLINVPIAKQHGITGLTLGMKNLMGVLGGDRGQIHQEIHHKLVDIASYVIPDLVVMDANRILVRNGPSGGDLNDVEEPRTVIAGTDQVLVDAYTTTLFEMTPTDIGYIALAAQRGLGSLDVEKARISKVAQIDVAD